MIAALLFLIVIILIALLVFQQVRHDAAVQTLSDRYEERLRDDTVLRDDLIRQVQVNAQGLPHYPQLGPFEPVVERQAIYDETGLVEVDVTGEERGRSDMPEDLFQ